MLVLSTHSATVVPSDNTRKSRLSVQNDGDNTSLISLTVFRSFDNTTYRFINPCRSNHFRATFAISACCRSFSPVVPPFLVGSYDFGVFGVEVRVLSEFANRADGSSDAPVFPADDNGGVLSVTALDEDVIIAFAFLCCREFYEDLAIRQHLFRGG